MEEFFVAKEGGGFIFPHLLEELSENEAESTGGRSEGQGSESKGEKRLENS